jgi:hypothetical protein
MNNQEIFNQEILDRNYDPNARSLKLIGDCAMWSIEKWHSIADIKRIVELEKELSSLVRGIKDLGSISYDQYPDTKTAENILKEHKL